MSEWIIEQASFLLQAMVIFSLVLVGITVIGRRRTGTGDDLVLKVQELNSQRRQRRRLVRLLSSPPTGRRKLSRILGREDKQNRKRTPAESDQSKVWVLEFKGDIKASATTTFSEEVSILIDVAMPEDEVVVKLESGGGLVNAYGLAAAQLDRLSDAGLATTICIDKVAASGGYMMACTGHHVMAAPFAIIGSIGVVAQVPNIHRLLKNNDIDVDILTAGRFKRTLTVLGENTDEGRAKFIDDLENTHRLFKSYVARRRPQLDIEQLATGEIWYGDEALTQGLVDSIQTSEAYLVSCMQRARVVSLSLQARETVGRKLGSAIAAGVQKGAMALAEALDSQPWKHR